jgi:hypothetical protein
MEEICLTPILPVEFFELILNFPMPKD